MKVYLSRLPQCMRTKECDGTKTLTGQLPSSVVYIFLHFHNAIFDPLDSGLHELLLISLYSFNGRWLPTHPLLLGCTYLEPAFLITK